MQHERYICETTATCKIYICMMQHLNKLYMYIAYCTWPLKHKGRERKDKEKKNDFKINTTETQPTKYEPHTYTHCT